MKEAIINNIFPTPIYLSKLDRKLTSAELKFVDKNKKDVNKNEGNITSSNNYILNENAKKLKKSGLDIDFLTKQIKINSTKKVCFDGIEYCIEKKDINHGTNSFVCTLKQDDEIINRLQASSKKLRNILNNY